MAQGLRMLAILAGAQDSVPGTHREHLTTTCNSSPRASDTFFLLQHLCIRVHTDNNKSESLKFCFILF